MLNVVVWVLQVLLALAFAAHGWLMLFPPPEVAVQMNASIPRWLSLFIGVAELVAALGLTAPGLTRIQPRLVPAAAVGLMIVTVSATAFHLWRGELNSALTTAALFILLAAVVYVRSRVLPIHPRDARRMSA